MIAKLIYGLCAVTSLFCFVMLWRGFLRRRLQLLLWSSAAFFAFTVANILLVVDLIFLPATDLSLLRSCVTLVGVLLLLIGLLFAT
jgi:hypothetical protein